MSARDPHRFANELDDGAIERLVARLENRGRDAVFTRLFEHYVDRLTLPAGARVVEIGCGTGVIGRALLARGDFAGSVLGFDQCAPFITAAERLAADAGFADRLSFQLADAHRLPIADGSCDVAIAHTLISHVTDPQQVLSEAARILAPGGQLVVFDGDYASLTYDYADDIFARRMDDALAKATFNNPLVMRGLARALPTVGLRLRESRADVVAEVGTASYFKSFAETYLPYVRAAGWLESAQIDAWWAAQTTAMNNGTFFASCNYYTYIAERVVPVTMESVA
ncbi:MAG: methyltransferase domain-containing protein [Pseudomonadota bacterium]